MSDNVSTCRTMHSYQEASGLINLRASMLCVARADNERFWRLHGNTLCICVSFSNLFRLLSLASAA